MGQLLCVDVVERVTEFLESPADSRLHRLVSEHTAVCWACANYVGEIGVTVRLLAGLPPEKVSGTREADLLAAFRAGLGSCPPEVTPV